MEFYMEEEKDRPTSQLEVDESLLTEEQKNEKKVSAPWGILIFCGVLALIIIALIIVIVNL